MIHVSDVILKRLQNRAERQAKPVEEVVVETLEENTVGDDYDESRDFLRMLAQTAEDEGWSSGRSDIAERSRELLDNEYP